VLLFGSTFSIHSSLLGELETLLLAVPRAAFDFDALTAASPFLLEFWSIVTMGVWMSSVVCLFG